MRTLTFLLFALLIAISAFAQWDVEETFTTGIPNGWTMYSGTWNWEPDGDSFPTPYVWARSNIDQNESPHLITAPIDISNADQVFVQYHYYFHGGGSGASVWYGFSPNGPW